MESMEEERHKDDCEWVIPIISLHALLRTKGYQTMQIIGKIKHQSLVMLIDSRSTYNFIDQAVARKLKCAIRVIVGV